MNDVRQFLGSAVFILASFPSLLMAEQYPVAWTKTNVGEKFEVLLDEKSSARFVNFFSFNAVLKQKNGSNFDNIVNKGAGVCDLVHGRGNCRGFDINSKDGHLYQVSWAGECYPIQGKDGKPVAHCAGGWSVLQGTGTGKFANISGGGTWKGHALENGEFYVEADGILEK